MLYPVSKNNKEGYITAEGDIAIPLEFDVANFFSEGLAGVKINGKWGYINESGNIKVALKYDWCWPFSCGLGLVEKGKNKYFIDKDGNVVINISFQTCRSFEDDLAFIKSSDYPTGAFIDKLGEVVLSDKFYLLSHHSQGLINCAEVGNPSQVNYEKNWGYINKFGEYIISPQYYFAYPFSEGLAAVSLNHESLFCFIDTTGNIIIKREFEGANPIFSEGLCMVYGDGSYGYIDNHGELVIPYQFYYSGPFSGGMAVVKFTEEAKYGYINKSGTIVIDPIFDSAQPFCGDLAYVVIGKDIESSRIGYINKTGDFIWEPAR